jgi:hypothetical protein
MTYKHTSPTSRVNVLYSHVQDWWENELILKWGEPNIEMRISRFELYMKRFFPKPTVEINNTPSIRFINRHD